MLEFRYDTQLLIEGENLDEDKIRDVMDVNYMGTLLPIQVFTKDMVD